ncbi:14004_t:CDS:2, partial [Racocetra fulgida]
FQARAGVGAQRINQGMTTPTSVKTNNRRTKGAAKAETQTEIEKMRSEHSEKMKNFTLRTEALSKSMQEIRKCEQLGSGSKELQYSLDGSLVGANSNELIDSNNSIEGIVGSSGVVDSSEIQGYLNQAGVPGMSGDPNMVGHSPFTSNTILSNEPNYMGDSILNVVETAYQEDSTGLVFDFINADDEVMNDNGDPHLAYNN